MSIPHSQFMKCLIVASVAHCMITVPAVAIDPVCCTGTGTPIFLEVWRDNACECPEVVPVGGDACIWVHVYDIDEYGGGPSCGEPPQYVPARTRVIIYLDGDIVDEGAWIEDPNATMSYFSYPFTPWAPGTWKVEFYYEDIPGYVCSDPFVKKSVDFEAVGPGDDEFITFNEPYLQVNDDSVALSDLEHAMSSDITWESYGRPNVATVTPHGVIEPGTEAGTVIVRANRGQWGTGCGDEAIFERPFDVFPEDGECMDCQGGNCGTGSGRVVLGSVNMSFRMGKDTQSKDVGRLWMYSRDVNAGLASPRSLHFDEHLHLADVEVISDNSGLRQVNAPSVFADIVVLDGGTETPKYRINFYDPADVGDWDGVAEVYLLTGTPFKTWEISYDTSTLVLTARELEEATELRKYEFTTITGTVLTVFDEGWPIQKEESWTEPSMDGEIHFYRRYEPSTGSPVYFRDEQYTKFSYGVRLTRQTEGAPFDVQVVTDWTYDETGRVKSMHRSDGYWTWYDYDEDGRITTQIEPWLDQEYPEQGAPETTWNRVTLHDYESWDLEDVITPSNRHKPRKTTVRLLDMPVSTTYYSFRQDQAPLGTVDVEVVIRCADSVAPPDNPLNLTTEHAYYNGDPDDLAWVKHQDGTYDKYDIETGTYDDGAGVPENVSFTPGPGQAKRTSITRVPSLTSEGVPFKTIMRRTVTNADEREVLKETFVYSGTGFERLDWTVWYYDVNGHLTDTYASDGTHESTQWDCCHPIYSVDSQGVRTDYDHDILGNLRWSLKTGVEAYGDYPAQMGLETVYAESYQQDRLCRTTTIQDDDGQGGTTLALETQQYYDTANRVWKTVSNSGDVTSYDYGQVDPEERRKLDVSRNGTLERSTTYHHDGRIMSITGGAVVERHYEYGVEADGKEWTKVYSGPLSLSSPRWEQTWYDGLGRKVKVEKPGFSPNSKVRLTYAYNGLGQLVRVSTADVVSIMQGGTLLSGGAPSGPTAPGIGGPGGGTLQGVAPTLYEYDQLGNLVRTGQDEDGNGTLDLESSDPITDTDSFYEQDTSGNWWYKSTTKVYPSNDAATTLTVSTTLRQLTGLAPGVTDVTKTIDQNGLETISTTTVDRENKLVTETVDVPNSDVDAVTIIRNGLVQSSTTPEGITYTYGYDGLARQTQVTDPRTGTQTTHYDPVTGRVDWVEDAELRRTAYTYYESGLKKDLVHEITNPDGKTTAYDYSSQGQVEDIDGTATHHIEIGYDDYGQRTSLSTYRGSWPDVTTWTYHPATGLLTRKTYFDDTSVDYEYTIGGLLATRTWARTAGGGFPLETNYTYFSRLGHLKKINYSDATPDVEFTYDRLGQMATVIDGVGTRTFTNNFSLPPVMSRTESITGLYDKAVAFVDWNGVSSVGDEYTEWRITAGPTSDVDGDYVSDYYSDTRGRISRVIGPGLTTAGVKYHYMTDSQDPDLALSSLIDRVEYMRPDGQGGEEVAGSSVRSYEDHRNLYASVANNWGATNVSTYGYANDSMGRRTHNLRSGSAFSPTHFDLYGYNDKSELTGSTRYVGSDPLNPPPENDDALTYGYAYDGIGNRLTSELDGIQTTYWTNLVNQYTSTTSPAESFTYDLDGNMTQDGTFDYTWDAENRLKSVTPRSPTEGAEKLVFTYDYRGRRVRKLAYEWDATIGETGDWSTTPSLDRRFLWHGWMLLMELNGNNDVVRKYTWGLDLSQTLQGAGGIGGLLACEDANETTSVATDDRSYAYFYDAIGNVGQLIDTTDPADANYGTIAARYEYDPYGAIVGPDDDADGEWEDDAGPFAAANLFRFSTKYFDAEIDYADTTDDGLYYYGYRYYSPRLGRWANRDPIGERGGNNLYAFARNQPTLYVDALGHNPTSKCADGYESIRITGEVPYHFTPSNDWHTVNGEIVTPGIAGYMDYEWEVCYKCKECGGIDKVKGPHLLDSNVRGDWDSPSFAVVVLGFSLKNEVTLEVTQHGDAPCASGFRGAKRKIEVVATWIEDYEIGVDLGIGPFSIGTPIRWDPVPWQKYGTRPSEKTVTISCCQPILTFPPELDAAN